MNEHEMVNRAATAANTCYLMVSAFPENAAAQVVLYRAACIALDSITLLDIVNHLSPTKEGSYIDQGIWDIIGDTAEEKMWEADCYRRVGESVNITRKCVEAAVEAIESSVGLYIVSQGKLTDATEDHWGSILDDTSAVSSAILCAQDSFDDAEEVYKMGEYPKALAGYWACYEALRSAGLLIGSYKPAIARQSYLYNLEHLEALVGEFRRGALAIFEAITEVDSPTVLISADSACKAFISAQDALDLAVANLRAAKLLEEDRND